MRMIMWVFIVYLPRMISISYLAIIAQCLSTRQKASLGLNKESAVLLHTLNVRVSSPFMCLHSPWRHGYPRWRRGMKTTTQIWSMKSPSCILTILPFTLRIHASLTTMQCQILPIMSSFHMPCPWRTMSQIWPFTPCYGSVRPVNVILSLPGLWGPM
jgi:hypothetical protein